MNMYRYIMLPFIVSTICIWQHTNSTMDIHEEAFTHIYTVGVWGKNNAGENFSGEGSFLRYCRKYIDYLEQFMKDHKIKSVVDAGCGDWEFSKHVNWDDIVYHGYDIVAYIIDKNRKKYGTDNIQFIHGNFLTQELPKADLLLCKHVLQHLTNDDILLFIQQLPNFKYCIITNAVEPDTLSSTNPDITVGGGHKIDLQKAPFNIKGTVVLNYNIGTTVQQVFLIDNTIEE